jgi:ribonuclease D
MSPTIKISKEEINELPLNAYEGPVHLVKEDSQLAEVLPQLKKESILGFDTESRPSFKKGQSFPASLIQLGGEKDVWLFQLHNLKQRHELWKILASPRIIKAGVAIQDDIKKLQEIMDFKPAGFIEIATLTQRAGILNTGLRNLAGLLLGFRISKRAQVSNWAKANLTEAQIQYAATDAWVSRELYLHMINLKERAATLPRAVSE